MINVGSIELAVVHDGRERMPPSLVFADMPAAGLSAALAGELDEHGQFELALHGVLVRAGGRLVLLDAGFGGFGEEEGGGGELLSSLRALGVTPADIDVVVISHGHTDHIGGLVERQGSQWKPVFTRAAHYCWADDWAFWTSDETLRSLPSELAEPARACLPPLVDLLTTVERETEVAPGVRLVSAAGHTPGHLVVALESEGQSALYVGDAIFHPLNVSQPQWSCAYDVDPRAAVRSRGELLARAARDDSLVIGFHLPEVGRVEAHGDGYRFVPIQPASA